MVGVFIILVFWVITIGGIISLFRRFGGECCLSFQGEWIGFRCLLFGRTFLRNIVIEKQCHFNIENYTHHKSLIQITEELTLQTVVYRLLTSHGLCKSMIFQILSPENMQIVVYSVATVSSLLDRVWRKLLPQSRNITLLSNVHCCLTSTWHWISEINTATCWNSLQDFFSECFKTYIIA